MQSGVATAACFVKLRPGKQAGFWNNCLQAARQRVAREIAFFPIADGPLFRVRCGQSIVAFEGSPEALREQTEQLKFENEVNDGMQSGGVEACSLVRIA
jgi:hypothetical protein